MKRSQMVQKMTEYWLGLYPNENYQDQDVHMEVQERMSQLLSVMERYMKPPVQKRCPVLLTDTHVWDRENVETR